MCGWRARFPSSIAFLCVFHMVMRRRITNAAAYEFNWHSTYQTYNRARDVMVLLWVVWPIPGVSHIPTRIVSGCRATYAAIHDPWRRLHSNIHYTWSLVTPSEQRCVTSASESRRRTIAGRITPGIHPHFIIALSFDSVWIQSSFITFLIPDVL
jgi:hypothetical protein